MYPIIIVPPDAWNAPEQLGTKFKFWYRDESEKKCLFKQGREGTGENWAEKAACEIAELLGLPHAHYDFATWRGHEGVASPSLVKEGSRLVLGNEVIRLPSGRYGNSGHLLRLVMAVMKLEKIKAPSSANESLGLASASDFFVGYLLLDALIGNQDRHDENWALIKTPSVIELAPTFDHASCLGRNESDEARIKRLTTADKGYSIETYVARSRSALYLSPDDKKTLLTVEAFYHAAKMNPRAGRFWINRLSEINMENFGDIFTKIPQELISVPAKDFALRMIELNKATLMALDF